MIKRHWHTIVLLLATFVLWFVRVGNHWASTVFCPYGMLMFFGSIVLSVFLSKRTSWFFLPIIATALISGVYSGIWPFNDHQYERDFAYKSGLERDAMYAYLCVVLSAMYIAFFEPSWIRKSLKFLRWIFWLSLLVTFYQYDRVPFEREGLYGNASINGCVIAALFPLILARYRTRKAQALLLALTFLGVYMTDASIPLGVLAVSVSGYLFVSIKNKTKALFWTGMTFADLGIAGYIFMGDSFFNSSGRFQEWKRIFAWWDINTNHWFGAGLGSTLHNVSYIQLIDAKPESRVPVYMWMHSDWLQTYFELGIVGLIGALIAYYYLLKKAVTRSHFFGSALGLGAMAVFNYPLRDPKVALCCVLLVAIITKVDEVPGC